MKIFAISVVKNEADVIESNLKAAVEWADKIFILDNGSTDGTWEKVLAMKNDVITPWKQDPTPFRDSTRSSVYNEFRHLASPGDWWCIRLDADEFYAEDPRAYLEAVPARYHYTCARFIQFHLTPEDVAGYHFTGDFKVDKPHIPHFAKTAWVEARFLRHRNGLVWRPESSFPRHMGLVYPKLIVVLHYQYRSPVQVQRRLDVRHAAIANGHHSPHVKEREWQEVLVSRDRVYHLNDQVNFTSIPVEISYLHKPYIYWIKRILHGLKILP